MLLAGLHILIYSLTLQLRRAVCRVLKRPLPAVITPVAAPPNLPLVPFASEAPHCSTCR